MKSKRAFLIEPGKFEIREVDVAPASGQMLVKVSACGLCNWELNHWKGLIHEPYPMTLGHEWSGIVVELGENVKGFAPGDVITGLGGGMTGFSEYIAAEADYSLKLDKNVNVEHAVGEPLTCVVNVLRAAAPEAGDFGVVMGCGPMGQWCTQVLSGSFLNALIAIDIDDAKLCLAQKFGATHTINPRKEDACAKLAEITEGRMADFVIEGTGSPALMNTAVSYLRNTGRGRLVLMSSHEAVCEKFDFREIISKSVEIRASHPRYSYNIKDEFRRAVKLLNRGVFKMEEIITYKFTLDDIQKAFETLENKPKDYLKGVVIP